MNFSPSFVPVSRIEWSNIALHKIEEIKERFSFYPEYNLPDALNNAFNWYEQEKNIRAQNASPKQSNAVMNLLLNSLKDLTKIPLLMRAIGTKNRDAMIDFFKTKPEPRHIRRIEVNDEEIFADETLSNVEDNIEKLFPDICRVIAACEQVISQISLGKPGLQAKISLVKRFIPHLIKIDLAWKKWTFNSRGKNP